jgi:hypothetical protein
VEKRRIVAWKGADGRTRIGRVLFDVSPTETRVEVFAQTGLDGPSAKAHLTVSTAELRDDPRDWIALLNGGPTVEIDGRPSKSTAEGSPKDGAERRPQYTEAGKGPKPGTPGRPGGPS